MTKSLIFTIIVLLGVCSLTSVATDLTKPQEVQLFYNIFKDWVSKTNKQYGIEEIAVRFVNWKSNYEMIQEQNSQDPEFQMEMNDFGDMTPEEFSALHLGLNLDLAKKTENSTDFEEEDFPVEDFSELESNDTELASNATLSNTTSLSSPLGIPKSVDWRKKGKVGHVRNQGQCGGCWSFAAAGALEGLYAIRKHKLTSFSVQQMIDCSNSYGNNGCDGGLMTNAYQYTHRHGIESESNYGFAGSRGNCRLSSSRIVFKNKGYKEVPSNNFNALKRAVALRPVSVGIEASTKVQFYKSGVITNGCGTGLDHAVLIVGYGQTTRGLHYWIVKNSWGPQWGLKGYFNVAMGSQNGGAGVCGINMLASYPTY